MGQRSQLKCKHLHSSQNAPFCGLVSGLTLMVLVSVTDIMLCDLALASIPLAVGRTCVGKSCVGVLARGRSPRHWVQCRNVKKKTFLRTLL